MTPDNSDKDFFNFLDKLIEQCTNNWRELRLISHLHKDTVQEIGNAFKDQSLSDFEEMTIRQELHSLITISLLDLCVILRMFKTSELLWERIFLIRKEYLTIYETIKAYEKQKNKIRQLIIASGYTDQQFLDINLEIKDFKKKYGFEKSMSKIRNKTSGHFDEDFDTFFDTVNEIEPSIAIEAIKSLMTILSKIDKFLRTFRVYLNKKIEEKNNKLQEEFNEMKKKLLNKLEDLKQQNNNH